MSRSYELPERYNGLGFKNLIYMVLQLKAFRDELLAADDPQPRVHLIIVEEPEAHLHPQMQTVFIDKSSRFVDAADKDGAQLILTTHSSHIVASCGLSPIRYFRRQASRASVMDLLRFRDSEAAQGRQAGLDFLIRYLTLTKCDLFFCDKAILIEGAVERLLLPRMMELATKNAQGDLTSTYVCTVEVGGAYAYLFRELVHFLQVPTLILTDLDAIEATRKKCRVADGSSSSNATLKQWRPGTDDLKKLLAATDAERTDGLVRIAFQVPESAGTPCGRTFEEAFIYANLEWLAAEHGHLGATGSLFKGKTAKQLEQWAFDASIPKVDFAVDLLLVNGWKAPRYIADGIKWLAEQPT